MSLADELWEKHTACGAKSGYMIYEEFLADLKEYGEAVRKRDAELCRYYGDAVKIGKAASYACAAAIEREPLP